MRKSVDCCSCWIQCCILRGLDMSGFQMCPRIEGGYCLARQQESCLQQYPLKLQAKPSWFEHLDLKGLTMPWSLTSNAYKAGWSANTFLRGCNCYSCRSICWPRTKETKAEPFHFGFRKETSTVSTKLPMRPNAPPTSAACQLHKARPLERVLSHQIHQIYTCDLKKAYILVDFGV